MQRKARHSYPRDNKPREYLDYVCRKTKPITVPQEDGQWPPYAMVEASSFAPRRPRGEVDLWKLMVKSMATFEPEIHSKPVGTKLCSCCGNYVKLRDFSPHKTTKDRLQSWCKYCKADHNHKMYWASKHTGTQAVA